MGEGHKEGEVEQPVKQPGQPGDGEQKQGEDDAKEGEGEVDVK